MNPSSGDGSFWAETWTVLGVMAAAILGAATKCSQWIDPKSGKFSWLLMISGVALCLITATAVHAYGETKHIDPWYQIVFTGVFCYIGPDPLIRAIMSVAMKRFGVNDGNLLDGKDP